MVDDNAGGSDEFSLWCSRRPVYCISMAHVTSEAQDQSRSMHVSSEQLSIISEDWRHPRGWPRQTWLCSVKLDFQPHNLGIDSEWKCAQDRSKWHQLCSLKGESPSDDDSNLILAVLTALEEDLYQWHSSVLKSRWWSGVFVLQMLNCWLHVIYSRQSVMSPMWWWLSERAPTLFILGCLSCHPCDDDSLKEFPCCSF